ncbi:DUF5710 domain-containing protein [Burkholderia sp. PAMC 28687]|uniref:DUF5710 domain-containing protein n=1 Tax=Burkholderia sp. PAMC 28687 TaxID=1795874 RepID=UPI000A4AF9AF|nr:DUF5710 domain-containing protein [Burkholderia sp. PAMC 28687]
MTGDMPLRRYLRVPANEFADAQALGALYDPAVRRLYVPNHRDPSVFARWLPRAPVSPRADGTVSAAEANLVIPQTLAYQPPVYSAWSRRNVIRRRRT